jgi:tetratricopeptide (TPR) repeat protein
MAERTNFSAEIQRYAARLEKDPHSRVFAQLADAYRKEGQLDEAVRICRNGLVAHPTYVSARVVLGRALLEQGALEAAEAEFSRVLELTPDHLLALQLLGDICVRRGHTEEARKYYGRARELNPFDRETQDRLAALSAGAVSVTSPPGLSADGPPPATGPGPDQVVTGASGPATSGPGRQATRPARDARGEKTPVGDTSGGGAEIDPLASPTLAALFASQGQAVAAERIYHQLEGLSAPPREERTRSWAGSDQRAVKRLLSLREAARRVRTADRAAKK